MTKDQLFCKYKDWAKRHQRHPLYSDLDDAPQVYSFNYKNKLHMFIFTMRCTWSEDPKNTADEEEVDVEYRLVIAF